MIHLVQADDFSEAFLTLRNRLLDVKPLKAGRWQSRDVSELPQGTTYELANVTIVMGLPQTAHHLAMQTRAHLPWAEDHFQERVSGEPLNPAPSEAWWPFAQKKEGTTNTDHRMGEKFSHTYPERIWPKHAQGPIASNQRMKVYNNMQGIRFDYGDLDDVIHLLHEDPTTRQAYLPIWFPEDTGVHHGQRVPCTLGYHFMIREDKLQITYYMRSCDLIRHFQDDVYMAGRLAQWVRDELNNRRGKVELEVGELIMHIVSLHIFGGDVPIIEAKGDEW